MERRNYKFYAFRKNENAIIFKNWDDCKDYIKYNRGGIFKGFNDIKTAKEWLGKIYFKIQFLTLIHPGKKNEIIITERVAAQLMKEQLVEIIVNLNTKIGVASNFGFKTLGYTNMFNYEQSKYTKTLSVLKLHAIKISILYVEKGYKIKIKVDGNQFKKAFNDYFIEWKLGDSKDKKNTSRNLAFEIFDLAKSRDQIIELI